MNEKRPFQYAILRYMHDAVTGEFQNVGLALYSRSARYFRAQTLARFQRISQAFPGHDWDYYRRYLDRTGTALDRLSEEVGSEQASFLGTLPERLDLLLQPILTPQEGGLQFSEVRAGLAEDFDTVFDQLYDRLVEVYLEEPERNTRDEEDVWQVFKHPLKELNVLSRLRPFELRTKLDTYSFNHAWKNGKWHVLQPVSFDLIQPTSIKNKAKLWGAHARIINTSPEFSKLYLLLGKPRRESAVIQKAYGEAKAIIQELGADVNLELVEEAKAEEFARKVKPLVEEHAGKH